MEVRAPETAPHRGRAGATTVPLARASAVPTARSAAQTVGVILAYLVIGCVAFWPVLPMGSQLYGAGADFVQSQWFVGWVPHALATG